MDATLQSLLVEVRRNPLDLSALEALRVHADRSGDLAGWAEGLELHIRALSERGEDPQHVGRLHFDLANLYRDSLKRLDRALAHYRATLDCDPAQRPAMAAARAIYVG